MEVAMSAQRFDVVVVGASLAGCATAILMARAGAKVVLVERQAHIEAYKHLCTHFIQASALPVMRRMGLDKLIEQAGGVRNDAEFHTPYGWVGGSPGLQADGQPLHGYNIRRSRLDPMLRELAANTPGVSLMTGLSAKALIERDGHIVGIEASGPAGTVSLEARLVVAADGRNSEMARLAGVKPRTSPNQRHGVLQALRGVDLTRGTRSQMWMTGPEVAYVFPNEDGVSIVAWMAPKGSLNLPRTDLLEALKARIRSLPDAPRLLQAEPVGELLAVKDFPNQWRPPVVRGMALVGDAATSLDYLQGIGCGWALQSAEWLADTVVTDLLARRDLAPGLKAYARTHSNIIGAHRFFINDFAGRLWFNGMEKLLYAAGAKDADFARRMMRVGTRLESPLSLVSPGALLRAVWINLRHGKQAPHDTRLKLEGMAEQRRMAA
jgi:menaquinone-9 beta-reductase